MTPARALWLWYVAPGDAEGRYWAIAPKGSIEPEMVVDEVHLRVPARTHRDAALARGFIEVTGVVLLGRTSSGTEATIVDSWDVGRAILGPGPARAAGPDPTAAFEARKRAVRYEREPGVDYLGAEL